MSLLSAPAQLLAIVFLAATTLSIGMQVHAGELRSLLSARGLLIRALFANFVIVPLAGVAIARLLPIPPAPAAALVLLAFMPGGLNAIQYTKSVRGQAPLAVGLMLVLCTLSVLISPILLQLVLPGGVDLHVPFGAALALIVLVPLLGLVLGVRVNDRAPNVAAKLAGPLKLLGIVAFLAVMILTKSARKEALGVIGAPAAGAMLGLVLVSMAVGWLLGGPGAETRQVLATSTSVRNAALAIAIAASTPRGEPLLTPLVGFSLLMLTPNLVFTLLNTILRKRAAKRAGPKSGSA